MFNNDAVFKDKPGPTKNIRALKSSHCRVCGKLIPLHVNFYMYCSPTCKAVRNYVVERGGAL